MLISVVVRSIAWEGWDNNNFLSQDREIRLIKMRPRFVVFGETEARLGQFSSKGGGGPKDPQLRKSPYALRCSVSKKEHPKTKQKSVGIQKFLICLFYTVKKIREGFRKKGQTDAFG